MTKEYVNKRTAEGLERMQEVNKTHGVYSFRDRGPDALDTVQRAGLAALQTKLYTRPGVIESMVDQVAKSIVMADMAISHVKEERDAGKSLNDIPLAKGLPAFNNSAVRALRTLYDMLPSESTVISAEEVLKSIQGDRSDEQSR